MDSPYLVNNSGKKWKVFKNNGNYFESTEIALVGF